MFSNKNFGNIGCPIANCYLILTQLVDPIHSLKNWLHNQSGEEPTEGEDVVRITFNNKQTIGRRYSVKLNVKIITSHAYIKIDTCDIQAKADIKPECGLFKKIFWLSLEQLVTALGKHLWFRLTFQKKMEILILTVQVGKHDFLSPNSFQNVATKIWSR